ncbi:hypothetical protein, partial [Staphylococcus aureus]|uniref:hypothetical protein n=1 Tax=Staphylococcus aureus TaxID=1280 RepID=UPI00301E028F
MVMERRHLAATAFLLASLGFHQSLLMNLLLAPLLVLNIRILIPLFGVLSTIYLTSLSGVVWGALFSMLNLTPLFESISEYGASSIHYRSGVRFDFWLFTTFFVGISVVAAWWNVVTEALPRVLIVSSIPFLLFGYIAYSDRLLVFAWFIIPAVIACCAAKFLMKCDRTFLFVVA